MEKGTEPGPKQTLNPEVQDVYDFCKELDDVISKAERLLAKCYSNNRTQKDLQHTLQNYVRKLQSLQFEMKTVYENIISLKTKITAVKSNLDDHQKQFKILKSEEVRQKYKLATSKLNSISPPGNVGSHGSMKRSEVPPPPSRRLFDQSKPSKVTFLGSQAKKLRQSRKKSTAVPLFNKPQDPPGITLLLHPLNNHQGGSMDDNHPTDDCTVGPILDISIPESELETTRTPTPIPSLASISWRSTRMSLQSSGTNNSISSSRQAFFPINLDDDNDID